MEIRYIKKPVDDETMGKFVNALVKLQEKCFNQELKGANIEKCSKGKITKKNTDGTYCVNFSFGTATSVVNKSGEDCSEGNFVKVYYDKDDMVGAYIGTVL